MASKEGVGATRKANQSGGAGQASISVITSVVTAIILGALGLFGNWASRGGLIGLIGGVTQAEMSEDIKQEIANNATVVDRVKFELLPGRWSKGVGALSDGSISVRLTQDDCPDGSTLIGGFCGSADITGMSKVNLQSFGFFAGKEFLCLWGTVTN